MIEYLRQFKDDKFDGLIFLPGPQENTTRVETFNYAESGKHIIESAMNHLTYHIFLFRMIEKTKEVIDLEEFEAVLLDPLEYISNLIPIGYYGFLMSKTTESSSYFDRFKQLICDKGETENDTNRS